jgi:hypothetical protein
MRLGDLCFLLVPSPLGLGTFFTQHNWLAATFVMGVLTVLGLFARFAHVLIGEIKEKGYWDWRERGEAFRDSQVDHDQKRRKTKLEGEQQRRELKRDGSSWWDHWRFRL